MTHRNSGREGERVSRGAAGVAVRGVGRSGTCAGEGTREHASTPSLNRPLRMTVADDRVDLA